MATANKNLSNYDKNTIPNAKDFRFGIVVSEWNDVITEGLYNGCLETLLDCGVDKSNIHRMDVPGSFELIYGAKVLSNINALSGIIVIGCVIKGETQHFEYVCQGVTNGIANLNADLRNNIPIIFCLLTDNNMQQSIDRSGGIHGNKGVEAAITALKLAEIRKKPFKIGLNSYEF
jgi:6,7-dimethyl-8-ribityllumazine synthase